MDTYSKTLELGKVDYNRRGRRVNRVTIEVELRQCTGNWRTVDLEPITEYTQLSICGAVWDGNGNDWLTGGQCEDTISELFPHDPRVQEIVAIWQQWHLNGVHAGTHAQEEIVKAAYDKSNRAWSSDYYGMACTVLEEHNLLIDRGYTYGHAWLVDVLPQEVIDTVKSW